MSTILLLEQNSEPAEVPAQAMCAAQHKNDAAPGCTCDRWGHPCLDCPEHKLAHSETGPHFHWIKKRGEQKWTT